MLHTYKAILRGNRLEWSDAPPADLGAEQPVAVHVTILEPSDQVSQPLHTGAAMVVILEQLAHSQAFAEIGDPSVWEREQREERHLPERAA